MIVIIKIVNLTTNDFNLFNIYYIINYVNTTLKRRLHPDIYTHAQKRIIHFVPPFQGYSTKYTTRLKQYHKGP